MRESTPEATPADVARVVRRDFADGDQEAVLAILAEYGEEDVDRVRLAVLKLSKGDLKLLRQYMDIALVDYRDVLWYAESPGDCRRAASGEKLPPKEINRIVEADYAQYRAWLTAGSDEA
jgi:hypothetical protein